MFYFNALVNFHFLKNESDAIIRLIEQTGITRVLDSLLTAVEYSNYDAWTAYRIGQAYENSGNLLVAGYFYQKAVDLAPFILEFQDKQGSLLARAGKYEEAADIFEFILEEDPRHTPAMVNLGYLRVRGNQPEKGEQLYRDALRLDPDHPQALLNLAAILLLRGRSGEALPLVDRLLRMDPGNTNAQQLRNRITAGN
jgi:tetratricopeptide (TPR) repeat protein